MQGRALLEVSESALAAGPSDVSFQLLSLNGAVPGAQAPRGAGSWLQERKSAIKPTPSD